MITVKFNTETIDRDDIFKFFKKSWRRASEKPVKIDGTLIMKFKMEDFLDLTNSKSFRSVHTQTEKPKVHKETQTDDLPSFSGRKSPSVFSTEFYDQFQ